MAYLAGLVGLLLVLTAEARMGSSSALQFCTETKECLLYKPICKNEDYEARHYDSVQWVSTKESSYFMEIATARAFRRLFNYISGSNKDGSKIEMTAPVIVKMGKRAWGYNEYTLSFLLPSDHQKNPPKPTDGKVYISAMPDMKVYVRSYGGWMMFASDRINSNSLKGHLAARGARYQRDYHYAVGYNSPMKVFNRHNEVWHVAEGEPVC